MPPVAFRPQLHLHAPFHVPKKGMEEKSKEFVEKDAVVYAKV